MLSEEGVMTALVLWRQFPNMVEVTSIQAKHSSPAEM